MKAHINGITIEGTPEEIVQYLKLASQSKNTTPFNPYKYGSDASEKPDWYKIITTVKSNIGSEIRANFTN